MGCGAGWNPAYVVRGKASLKQEGLVFSEFFAEGYSDQKGMIEALELLNI